MYLPHAAVNGDTIRGKRVLVKKESILEKRIITSLRSCKYCKYIVSRLRSFCDDCQHEETCSSGDCFHAMSATSRNAVIVTSTSASEHSNRLKLKISYRF